MIRVVSSISKLSKFTEGETIIDEGMFFYEILFFVKGEAKVFKTLNLCADDEIFCETIEINTLSEGDVVGEHFYSSR